MKKYLFLGLLFSQASFAQTTISSLAEFIELQDASNQNIKMKVGTYHISSSTKKLFDGGDWRVVTEGSWPGLFKFTGNNNEFDLSGVTFTYDSTILSEMPAIVHGSLVELGGKNNTWTGFNLQEVASSSGEYVGYKDQSGGTIVSITGSGHQFYDLTVKAKFSRPYGFGSIYGKTGSSVGSLPDVKIGKKSGLFLTSLSDSHFENVLVDHSAFGHTLFMKGPIEDVVLEDVTIIAETRSTNELRSDGIGATDRNGVPFGVRYQGVDLIGDGGNAEFFDAFETDKLDQCQNLGSGTQNSPIKSNYQYSLVEGAFRGYTQEEINNVVIRNAKVHGARAGIALETSGKGIVVENMKVTGVAGHGVPSCGGWNGTNGGEGDATAYGLPSYSVATDVQADAAYATVFESTGDREQITADIEVLDPEDGYRRPSAATALALISGDDHVIRLWKADNKSLTKDLVIKVGNDATDNLLLCNMTKQPVTISSSVTNSTIYSVGDVSDSSSGSANNKIVELSSASDEPQICSSLGSSGGSSSTGDTVDWGERVVIAASTQGGYTSNCGWYGCRVAYMTDDRELDVKHGKDDPTGFYIRKSPGVSYGDSCVQWHDKVVVAYSSQNKKTTDCGWFGCRVAALDDTGKAIRFSHGLNAPTSFHVRPPAGQTKSGCISHSDEVLLAYSSQNKSTSNCGWYGCRVLKFDGNDLIVSHGLDDPQGVRLRSWSNTND